MGTPLTISICTSGSHLCPVYVEDAQPGDALRVDILGLETGDWGWTAIVLDSVCWRMTTLTSDLKSGSLILP